MGADPGIGEAGEASRYVIRLIPGRYRLYGLSLAFGGSLIAQGEDQTILEGTVWGLRSGATLAQVTVTGGREGGIVISRGERAAIENCKITGNFREYGAGILCGPGSWPSCKYCIISRNFPRYRGGGFYLPESSPALDHCMIAGNCVTEEGGGLY